MKILFVGIICALFVLPAGTRVTAMNATEAIQTSGIKGGLTVVIGCADPDALVELGERPGYVVHAVDTRAERVETATAALLEQGLYGKVAAARWNGMNLPYIDNLVNLLLDPQGMCPPGEIRRVLAPGGVGLIKETETLEKDLPTDTDDWSHHLYDASGIATSRDFRVTRPRSMQWKAGPEYGRSHENMASVSAVVSAGRRVFSIMDEGPAASIYLPSRWSLSARDAFSGVLLWKIPVREWHARLFPLKSGPQQLPRRLVATPDRVYATLAIDAPVTELDAATGNILRTFSKTNHAEEILHTEGKLVVVVNEDGAAVPYQGKTPQSRPGFVLNERALNLKGTRSVVLVDLQTGNERWRTPPGNVISLTITAADKKVAFVRGNRLVCLDMTTGNELWSEQIAKKTLSSGNTRAPVLLIHEKIIYTTLAGTLTARSLDAGKELWSAPCARSGYKAPTSLFVLDDLIWDVNTGGEPYRPGHDLDTVNRYFVGYDLHTGREKKRIPVSGKHGYAIMHHRCHVPRAAGNSIITSFPGIEFFDVTTGQVTHDSWIRGACLYGFMPANGLLYTPPHPCACYTQAKLTGFWAVAGKRKPRPPPENRLAKGPSYTAPTRQPASAEDWPTYRGNAARSGVTETSVPAKLTVKWTVDIQSAPSQCVVADGRAFVADKTHTVHALNAATGKKLWEYTAEGRVDSPPTCFRNRMIFGSRDGYAYCLTADRGELAWRFLAAPRDLRSIAYDQVESVWPVHGNVMLQENIAWFCAGRSSYLDGGLLVYRLDAISGKLLSTTHIDSLAPDNEQKPIIPTMFARLDMEGAKNDILSCDGKHAFMRHWAFDLNGTSIPREIDHLFSPTGFPDDSWFRRTYWIYGRTYVSGAQGWARTGNQRPAGRILSIDEDRIYGFGRNMYPPSPGNRHQMYLAGEKEVFFAAERTNTESEEDSGPAQSKKPRKKKGRRGEAKSYLWSTPGDIQVRGMVLAGRGRTKRLITVGAKGDWVTSLDAYRGKKGNVLRTISITDGSTISEQPIPGLPVFDGLSAAQGRLYICLVDGQILCLAGNP